MDTTETTAVENIKTNLLSSNHTLFWRVFVPVFGTVLLLALLLGFWMTSEEDVYNPLIPLMWMRFIVLFFIFGWLFFIFRTILKLKRVDANPTHIFVSDYWTTARYPWEDIESINVSKRMGRRIATMHLKGKGVFGEKFSFLPGTYYDEWMKKNKENLITSLF